MKAFQFQNLLRIGTVAAVLAVGGVAAHAQPGQGVHHGRGGPAMMAPGWACSEATSTACSTASTPPTPSAARSGRSPRPRPTSQASAKPASCASRWPRLYAAQRRHCSHRGTLRSADAAQHEAATKRMTQAMIDAAAC